MLIKLSYNQNIVKKSVYILKKQKKRKNIIKRKQIKQVLS